jgi:hypothetical protein
MRTQILLTKERKRKAKAPESRAVGRLQRKTKETANKGGLERRRGKVEAALGRQKGE